MTYVNIPFYMPEKATDGVAPVKKPFKIGHGNNGIAPMTLAERNGLNLLVARVVGLVPIPHQPEGFFYWEMPGEGPRSGFYNPTDDWGKAGPLLDKAMLEYKVWGPGHVEARYPGGDGYHAENHRIAAMLCIASDARSSIVFDGEG